VALNSTAAESGLAKPSRLKATPLASGSRIRLEQQERLKDNSESRVLDGSTRLGFPIGNGNSAGKTNASKSTV
jgi:hypothetical protein